MADVFDTSKPKKKRGKSQEAMSDDEIKHAALLEIAGNPVMRKYFQILLEGYDKSIINMSRPKAVDEKYNIELLSIHAKRESVIKLMQAAQAERDMM